MAASKNITMIPARKRVGSTVRKDAKPKLRVAAYCRVSTDSDEQASSYEKQVEHYTDFIKANAEWEFAGIYADDGISGTNTKKREEFNRMIEDCMAGRIDMIITKSISRFARNTLDCLKYIRQLKEKNIPVFFEKENINTMDSKGEVLLTIMASLAQQESESLSKNVKLGLQFRYQNGEVQINHNRFLGYTKDENGHLIIEPEEAEIVKRIYREYFEGKSLKQIGDGLMKDGILTAAKKPTWRPEPIKKILQNEKYIGDALLQKTYTVDVLTKKRVKNNGIMPQYYVENNHEPIIPRDLYMQVQEEILRRANLHSGANRKKRVYSSKYALSSICYCPMMIYYPVTPKRCIILHKRNYVENKLNEVINETTTGEFAITDLSDITQEAYRREEEQLAIVNPESIKLNEEDVLIVNTCCIGLAERYVISNQDLEKQRFWIDSYGDLEKQSK